MANWLSYIFGQADYFSYFHGILFVLLAAIINIIPNKFRDKYSLQWCSATFFLIGIVKIANPIIFGRIFSAPSFPQQALQLLSVFIFAEFSRRNWETAFGFKLSSFIHFPLLIISASILFVTQNLYSGPGGILIGILFLFSAVQLFQIIVKKNKTEPEIWITVISALLLSTSQISSALPGFKPMLSVQSIDQLFEIYLSQFVQILSLVILSFSIALSRLRHDTSERLLESKSKISHLSPLLLVAIFFTINLGGAAGNAYLENIEKLKIISSLNLSSESLGKVVNQRIQFATTSSNLIAATPAIRSYMQNPTPEATKLLDEVMQTFLVNFPDGMCYIMDIQGTVLACSTDKELMLGKNFRFRPYFQDAIKGQNGRMIALGKVTYKVGFYSSFPIFDNDKKTILGVCCVKRNLDDLETYFKLYHPVMLLDSTNKIFMSSDKSIVGTRISLPIKRLRANEPTSFMHISGIPKSFSTENYAHTLRPLNLQNWSLLLLNNANSIPESKSKLTLLFFLLSIISVTFLFGHIKNFDALYQFENAQKQFKSIFMNAPESIIIVSPKTLQIHAANESMLKQFELNSSPVGMLFTDLLPENTFDMLPESIQNYESQSFIIENKFRRASGELFTAEVTGTITEFNGESAVLLFLRDISVRKQTENKLREAKNSAEEANRIKSRFLANTSHEIRTPMTAIIGLTEIAMGQSQNPEQSKILELIQSSGRSLLDLLNDILDLSKIEAGKMEIDLVPFELKDLVDKVMQIVSFKAEKKKLKTSWSIQDEIPETIISDPQRIRQVLLNLLTNSLKFTQRGEISLKISLKTNDRADFLIDFSVTDTGPGIPPEIQNQLFKAFSNNLNPYAPGENSGAGLGLAICKQIVEMLGGSISVESSPGHGSTFRFSIPTRKAQKTEKEEINLISDKTQLKLVLKDEPLKILIADDNETNLFLASTIVEQHGGAPTCVKDGIEVLSILERKSFDIILLDIQMPRLDGLSTIKRLREHSNSSHRGVPIIAISAFAADNEKKKAIKAGADFYLSKPYFPNDLINAIKLVLSPSASYQEMLVTDNNPNKEQRVDLSENTDASDHPQLKHINSRELEFRVLKKPENIRQIYLIYQKRSKLLVEKLNEAKNLSDPDLMKETAHSIKGLVGMLAASNAYNTAREIETLAKEGNIIKASTYVEEMNTYILEIGEDLKILIDSFQ